jgi:proteic killer suppression protein
VAGDHATRTPSGRHLWRPGITSWLNAAMTLNDLRVPPSNHLEELQGDKTGKHSIRVNDQFRICFAWTPAGPMDIEFTDYH